jgi:hypothetical protein
LKDGFVKKIFGASAVQNRRDARRRKCAAAKIKFQRIVRGDFSGHAENPYFIAVFVISVFSRALRNSNLICVLRSVTARTASRS